MTPSRSDLVLAAALFVACQAEVIVDTVRDGHHHWPLAVNIVIVAGVTVPLAWRRLAPLTSLVIVMSNVLLLTSAAGLHATNFPQLVLFVGPYSVAAHSPRRRAVLGLAYAVLVLVASNLLNPSGGTSWVFSLAIGTGAPWAVGRMLRARRKTAAKLEHTAALLVAEEGSRELLAIAEQRSRIARELQTLIAQGVSTMIVQTQAAQRLLADRPNEADAAMQAIETTGRQALADMRRVLGVLRDVDDEPELRPQPGVGQIPALVEQQRRTHPAVVLDVTGAPGPIPASVDLAVYRVLEEALASLNSTADATRVELRFGDNDVELTVTPSATPPLDWPTPAMRERAALCRGTVEIETSNGRDQLVLLLPRVFEEAVA